MKTMVHFAKKIAALVIASIALLMPTLAWAAAGPSEIVVTDRLKLGASMYRTCYYCHSLKPGVHLTGPSLAGLWGKPAGQVAGFDFYSGAIKKSSVLWNEAAFKKWLSEPNSLIAGTGMTFEGIKDASTLQATIDFLKIAMGPSGIEKVLAAKLIDEETATGELPKDLSHASEKDMVASIVHCKNAYTLTMVNGETIRYWEMNLDFKVNSDARGPLGGKPVRIMAGSMGDRFAIVFHEPKEITRLVKDCAH